MKLCILEHTNSSYTYITHRGRPHSNRRSDRPRARCSDVQEENENWTRNSIRREPHQKEDKESHERNELDWKTRQRELTPSWRRGKWLLARWRVGKKSALLDGRLQHWFFQSSLQSKNVWRRERGNDRASTAALRGQRWKSSAGKTQLPWHRGSRIRRLLVRTTRPGQPGHTLLT